MCSGEQWTGSFYNIYWKFTWHIGPLYIFVLNCFGQCSYRYYVKTNTSCNYLVVVITKNAGYLFFLLKISEFFMSQFADKRTAKCGPESYVLSIPMSMELWKCCHLLLHASLWFDRSIFNTSSFTGRKIQYIFEKYIRK